MLALFRKNGFVNSILLLVYAIILQLIPLFMAEHKAEWFGSVAVTMIIHFLIIFLQAVFINRLIIENRIHRDIMLFPGLFYILYSSLLPSFWQYHHIHFANFFMVWGLYELFKIYKTNDPAAYIFNASFLIGIASIFCPTMIFYLITIFLGISNLKKMELVHPLQIIVGGLIPWFLLLTYKVYNHTEQDIITLVQGHFGTDFFSFASAVDNFYSIIFAVLCFFILLTYNEIRKKKHIQAQKKVDILYLALITSVLVMLFHAPASSAGLLFSAPFIGVFIGLLISHIRNTAIAEMIHLLVFAGIIVFQIFTFFKFTN